MRTIGLYKNTKTYPDIDNEKLFQKSALLIKRIFLQT